MPDKRYHNGAWFLDPSWRLLCHVKAGWYEEAIELPDEAIDVRIDFRDIPSLVESLEQQGHIKPRLDERLRVEDLKITHRLLDIIEKRR